MKGVEVAAQAEGSCGDDTLADPSATKQEVAIDAGLLPQSNAMFRFLRGESPAKPKKESVRIGGHDVEIVRRPRKRSMGLSVHVSGRLRVSAPKTVSLKRIVDFVESQREWVEKSLAKYAKLRESYPRKRILEGERFPFLGRELQLAFERTERSTYSVRIKADRLVFEIPTASWKEFARSEEHRELRPLLRKFYQKAGRELLTARVEKFSAAMDLHPSALSFRAQKTRWGSCSSKGRISLNWRLIVAPLDVIDYVVVHELSHLRCYDHSAAFWRLVATQIPDYKVRREWLRDHVYDADFLALRSEIHA